jgi:hypothetical protein
MSHLARVQSAFVDDNYNLGEVPSIAAGVRFGSPASYRAGDPCDPLINRETFTIAARILAPSRGRSPEISCHQGQSSRFRSCSPSLRSNRPRAVQMLRQTPEENAVKCATTRPAACQGYVDCQQRVSGGLPGPDPLDAHVHLERRPGRTVHLRSINSRVLPVIWNVGPLKTDQE